MINEIEEEIYEEIDAKFQSAFIVEDTLPSMLERWDGEVALESTEI